jgi:glycosyltransferase involved in cell wall biosynthesis
VTGSVNHDVDLGLLQRVADRYPERNLVILGNNVLRDPDRIEAFRALVARPNVHFAGFVHYLELKNYIAASDVCLVPYQSQRPGFYRNPIKITNYITQYKPVVNTVEMPELSMLQGRILFTSSGADGFLALVAKALAGECRVDKDFVQEYLREHLYEKLVEKILDRL